MDSSANYYLIVDEEGRYVLNTENDSCMQVQGGENADDTFFSEGREETKDGNNRWSHNAVLQLIDGYKNNLGSFTSSCVRNEVVWKKISAQLQAAGCSYSPKQCEFKFKNLKKRYHMKCDNMKSSQSGASSIKFEYFDQFHEIFGKKPNVVPLAVASSSRGAGISLEGSTGALSSSDDEVQTIVTTGTSDKTKKKVQEPPKKKTKLDLVLSHLAEMNAKKEQERDRRHRELLQLQNEAIQMFGEKMDKLIEKL